MCNLCTSVALLYDAYIEIKTLHIYLSLFRDIVKFAGPDIHNTEVNRQIRRLVGENCRCFERQQS